MPDPTRAYQPVIEWGVEVWPDTDSPYNRVDPYASRERAEAGLRDFYGSATRLVCREMGGTWRPSDSCDMGASGTAS